MIKTTIGAIGSVAVILAALGIIGWVVGSPTNPGAAIGDGIAWVIAAINDARHHSG